MDTPTDLIDLTELANAHLDGFNQHLGLRFTHVTVAEVVAELPVRPHLLQPYGIVHGGVYAAMAESICSVGAGVNTLPEGRYAVGLDNQTSFVRAAREGVILGRATPIHQGRRTHLWQAELRDGEGRLLATSRVRLMVLDAGAALAGEDVQLRDAEARAELSRLHPEAGSSTD